MQVIGSVSTILALQYGDVYATSNAKKYVGDIAFAGTVVGQLAFGWLSDHWSRSNSLLVSTVILVIFTALAAGSYYHGDSVGMFNILTAWRFFVSFWFCHVRSSFDRARADQRLYCRLVLELEVRSEVSRREIIRNFSPLTYFFIGEYPAGSVGCAESTGELKSGTRNRWFILFTNTMIDWVSIDLNCPSRQGKRKGWS